MLKKGRFTQRTVWLAALPIAGALLLGWPRDAPAESAGNLENDADPLSRLQALVGALNTHVTNLELNSVTLQQQIGYLQAANQNLEDEIKTLKAANEQLRQDLQQQEDRYVGLENAGRDMQGQMRTLENRLDELRRLQNDVVISLQNKMNTCRLELNGCYGQVGSLQNQLNNRRNP